MNIAVVGAGIAGLTVSFLLKEQGHKVTLFEQAPKCLPVGAGFLLQPSGQKVVSDLGILNKIEEVSPKLHEVFAETRARKTLVSLRYNKIGATYYALGVRRSLLFSILFNKCVQSGVEIVEGARIESASQNDSAVQIELKNKVYKFDLMVASDGTRSAIRKHFFPQVKAHEYSYAALWTLCPAANLQPRLWQMVEGTKRLIGILPVEKNLCSFFWGIRQDEKEIIWKNGIDYWRDEVCKFLPDLEEIASSVTSLEDLSYGTYRHVCLPKYHKGRIVFIGDAAHSSTPHLGQGVNLALEDAFALASEFRTSSDYKQIFSAYESKRFGKTKYYSNLTFLLSPFFQSDYSPLAWGRDIALPIMYRMPYVGSEMVRSVSGLKKGWIN